MGIDFPPLNKDVTMTVSEALSKLQVVESPSLSLKLGIRAGRLEVSKPFPVFSLALRAVSGETFVIPDRPSFWRCILFQEKEPLAFADMAILDDGSMELLRFTFGPHVIGLVQTMALAEEVLFSSEAEAALGRVIELPEINMKLFWLQGDQSLFLPIGPDFIGMGLRRTWTLREIYEIARAAGERLKGDDVPDCVENGS
jgi:hypothetical protein